MENILNKKEIETNVKPLFKLEQFEGPLDLLLHLISKHKLNIYDIEINELVHQYVNYVNKLTDDNLDIASEFLEMAARLVHIKSVMLLPKHDEDVEELKKQLSGELIEYSIIKEISAELGTSYIGDDIFVRSPEELPIDYTYKNIHPISLIYDSMINAMGKNQNKIPPPEHSFDKIVRRKVVSVNSRIVFILRYLHKNNILDYDEIFEEASSRSELVATFLAILELIKSKRIYISDDNSTIYYKNINSGSINIDEF